MRITLSVGIIVGANFIAGHVISVVLGEEPFLFDNYIFDNSSIFAYNKSLLIHGGPNIQTRVQNEFKVDILLNDVNMIGACTVVWQNVVYAFGGVTNPKRALKLERLETRLSKTKSCSQFKQYRELTFDFISTSCLNQSHDLIYLCFSTNESRTCRYAKDPWEAFGEYPDVMPDSFYSHIDIVIAATDAYLIAIGGSSPPSANVELYDINEQKWIISNSYPYSSIIHTAPVVAYKQRFYVFGGGHPTRDLVAQFDNEFKWTIVGRLTAARAGHSFVLQSQYVLIFGGSGITHNAAAVDLPTEKCLLTLTEDVQCSAQMPMISSGAKVTTIDQTMCPI